MEAYVKHILVPTDLSDFATLALRYGKMLFERLGSRVTLLHAAGSTGVAALAEHPLGYYLENRPEEVNALQEILREQAAQNGLLLDSGDLIVVQDLPGRSIVETAKNRDVDLIVMGTHGRAGWRRAVLGSVAERVLHQAPCPVLTVTPKRMDGAELDVRRVLCPIDFSDTSRSALDVAASMAESFDAELMVLHVAEEPSASVLFVKETFSNWVSKSMRANSRYEEIVKRGDVAMEILGTADAVQADLIVLGAERRVFREATTFGANSYSILRNAQHAVLTVSRLQPRQMRFARRLRQSA